VGVSIFRMLECVPAFWGVVWFGVPLLVVQAGVCRCFMLLLSSVLACCVSLMSRGLACRQQKHHQQFQSWQNFSNMHTAQNIVSLLVLPRLKHTAFGSMLLVTHSHSCCCWRFEVDEEFCIQDIVHVSVPMVKLSEKQPRLSKPTQHALDPEGVGMNPNHSVFYCLSFPIENTREAPFYSLFELFFIGTLQFPLFFLPLWCLLSTYKQVVNIIPKVVVVVVFDYHRKPKYQVLI